MRWLVRAPLLLVSALLIVTALVPIVRTLRVETPARPWDAALIVDAARAAAGRPVYEDAERGHATLMYGPILPYVYGAMFAVTGPSNMSPRLVTVASVIALLALMIVAARRLSPFPSWMVVVALGLLLAADARTEYRYAHVRPDMISLLAAFLAVAALYRGHVRRSDRWYAAGILGILVAVMLKQQMAAFAFVPALPILLDRGLSVPRRVLLAGAPPAAGLLLVLALKFGAPTMYFYMVTLGGEYTVFPKLVARSMVDFAISIPFFLALLLHGLLRPGSSDGGEGCHWTWAISAILVTIPTSALSFGKLGGAPNSWLPALLAVLFATMLYFRDIAGWLEDQRFGIARRIAVSSLLGILALLCFPGIKSNFIPVEGDTQYRAVIDLVRQLPGRVETPEDPTITLHARGHFGRSLYAEYDARPIDGHWPTVLPAVLEREYRAADYLVEIHDPLIDFFGPDEVTRLGFTPVKRMGRYTLWQRQ